MKKRAKEICIINSEELLDKLQIRYYQKRKYHTGLNYVAVAIDLRVKIQMFILYL